MSDGRATFTLPTCKALSIRVDVLAVGAIAATVVAHAVACAVVQAKSPTGHQLAAYRDALQD